METPFGRYSLEALNEKSPPSLDFAFLAAGGSLSQKWGWRLVRRGAVVIDKSSYFREKSYAPLIVPEVNGQEVIHHRGIIANPNCTTIPLVMALAPLDKLFGGVSRVLVVSLQSVSGQGRSAQQALEQEIADPQAAPTAFPHRIAYNVIPWIGSYGRLYSGEERKIIYEARRILNRPRLSIRATAVRVPTKIGHALAVHANFRAAVDVKAARRALERMEGLLVVDDPERNFYPTPLMSEGRDEVLVGRIRRDFGKYGLALWVVADNLRKGAATNAVQIAERVAAAS